MLASHIYITIRIKTDKDMKTSKNGTGNRALVF